MHIRNERFSSPRLNSSKPGHLLFYFRLHLGVEKSRKTFQSSELKNIEEVTDCAECSQFLLLTAENDKLCHSTNAWSVVKCLAYGRRQRALRAVWDSPEPASHACPSWVLDLPLLARLILGLGFHGQSRGLNRTLYLTCGIHNTQCQAVSQLLVLRPLVL